MQTVIGGDQVVRGTGADAAAGDGITLWLVGEADWAAVRQTLTPAQGRWRMLRYSAGSASACCSCPPAMEVWPALYGGWEN